MVVGEMEGHGIRHIDWIEDGEMLLSDTGKRIGVYAWKSLTTLWYIKHSTKIGSFPILSKPIYAMPWASVDFAFRDFEVSDCDLLSFPPFTWHLWIHLWTLEPSAPWLSPWHRALAVALLHGTSVDGPAPLADFFGACNPLAQWALLSLYLQSNQPLWRGCVRGGW